MRFWNRRRPQARWVRRMRLRSHWAPSDWRQTLAEMQDREMPWLKYRRL